MSERTVIEATSHCRIVGFDVSPIHPHSVMLRLHYVLSADDAGDFVTDHEVEYMQSIMDPETAANIAEKLFIVSVAVKGPSNDARKPN
jgi:hypothetical protein